MFPRPDSLIIMCLILSPDISNKDIPPATPGLWKELKAFNHRLELCADNGFYFSRFESEIYWTRKNYRQCANCPSIIERENLPTQAYAQLRLHAICKEIECIESRFQCKLYLKDEYNIRLRNLRIHQYHWNLVDACWCNNDYSKARLALKWLTEEND